LILDELERGIQQITNPQIRMQNLSFLQMISEEAHRSTDATVTIFASVYDSGQEPGATLKRIQNRVDVHFSDSQDKRNIVLHRLFSNHLEFDRNRLDSVITGFASVWKNAGYGANEKELGELKESYPFSPVLFKMLSERLAGRGGFQGSRGALGLLGALVRNQHQKADLITSAHLFVDDAVIKNRLTDIESSQQLISCAIEDNRNLQNLVLGREVIAAALGGSLAPLGRNIGIADQLLAREVIKPGDDINQYHTALQALLKFGTHFQLREGNYFFDLEEKPNSKVEYRSLRIDPQKALDEALRRWKEQLFREPKTVVFKDGEQARAELAMLEPQSIRFVASPRRLLDTERVYIYEGAEFRNLIVLLEPKSDTFNGLNDTDILKWAQRTLAAMELAETAADAERKKQYETIAREDSGYILDAFKRAGLMFMWMIPSSDQVGLKAESETLGNAVTAEDVKRQLREAVFPSQLVREHMQGRLADLFNKTVRHIHMEYRKTLGFPICVAETIFYDAIRDLCKNKKIGIRHERDSACGRAPAISDNELLDATIVEPFVDTKDSPSIFTPTDKPGAIKTDGGQPVIDGLPKPGIQVETIVVQTTFMASQGELRQEIARRLLENNAVLIKEIKISIYSETNGSNLEEWPAAIRGMLNGTGDVTVDILLRKNGDFTKAQAEQMAESLPKLPGAKFKAEMKIEKGPTNA
jgi:hypothetical protein